MQNAHWAALPPGAWGSVIAGTCPLRTRIGTRASCSTAPERIGVTLGRPGNQDRLAAWGKLCTLPVNDKLSHFCCVSTLSPLVDLALFVTLSYHYRNTVNCIVHLGSIFLKNNLKIIYLILGIHTQRGTVVVGIIILCTKFTLFKWTLFPVFLEVIFYIFFFMSWSHCDELHVFLS